MALATIDEALKRIRRGEMVLVVDDEDRENEGDLTMAASWVTPEAINFMLRWARGLVCMPCAPERLDELDFWPMVPVRPRRLRHARSPCRSTTSPRAAASAPPTGPHDPQASSTPTRAPVRLLTGPATCSRCGPARAACSSAAATPRPRSTSPGSPGSRRSR